MSDKAATLTGNQLEGFSLLGSRSASQRGRAFNAVNPGNGARLAPAYYSATREELEVAAELASEAFPAYSRLPGKAKARFLRAIARNIEDISEALVSRAMEETALSA